MDAPRTASPDSRQGVIRVARAFLLIRINVRCRQCGNMHLRSEISAGLVHQRQEKRTGEFR
jgi:hypothetical protein